MAKKTHIKSDPISKPNPLTPRIDAIEARLDALENPTISPLLKPTWLQELKTRLGIA